MRFILTGDVLPLFRSGDAERSCSIFVDTLLLQTPGAPDPVPGPRVDGHSLNGVWIAAKNQVGPTLEGTFGIVLFVRFEFRVRFSNLCSQIHNTGSEKVNVTIVNGPVCCRT